MDASQARQILRAQHLCGAVSPGCDGVQVACIKALGHDGGMHEERSARLPVSFSQPGALCAECEAGVQHRHAIEMTKEQLAEELARVINDQLDYMSKRFAATWPEPLTISEAEVASLEQWVAHFEPSAIDPSGETVPISRSVLAGLLIERHAWKRRALEGSCS